MQSSMQTWRLTVDRILDHAAAVRPRTEVVTAGTGARMTYAQLHVRAQRLASALAGLGVRPGDRVAVAGAGDARQLEAWYAVTGLGAVCHPVNPRLPPERLAALLNVGGARVLFADPAFLAAVEPALRQAPAIEQVVLMGPEARILDGAVSRVTAQDVLVERGGREAAWGGAAETDPAVLVHTVGVAGEPKAVLWSHRACVLQALIAGRREGLSLSAEDVVLPLIPFWRAGAWGAVFSAPMAGARLVLPAMADIGALHELIDQEGVTLLIASPTHLQGLLDLTRGRRPRALTRAVAAGAACPPALAAGWSALGVKVLSAWGMAETTALGPMFDPAAAELHAPFGLELEVVDGDGRSAPRDGAAVGHLRARGPTVAAAYFPDGASALDVSGFLDTGDLATADAEGGVRLRGRADDTLQAGGALVCAQAIEAAALEHPATLEAAVVEAPENLGRGPLLIVRRRAGATAGKADYLRHLRERLGPAAPADVLFADGLPRDAAGRVHKPTLRERLAGLNLPAAPQPAEMAPAPAALPVAAASVAAAALGAPVLYQPPEPEPEAAAEPVEATPTPEEPVEAEPAVVEAEPIVTEPAAEAASEESPPPAPKPANDAAPAVSAPHLAAVEAAVAAGLFGGMITAASSHAEPEAAIQSEPEPAVPAEAGPAPEPIPVETAPDAAPTAEAESAAPEAESAAPEAEPETVETAELTEAEPADAGVEASTDAAGFETGPEVAPPSEAGAASVEAAPEGGEPVAAASETEAETDAAAVAMAADSEPAPSDEAEPVAKASEGLEGATAVEAPLVIHTADAAPPVLEGGLFGPLPTREPGRPKRRTVIAKRGRAGGVRRKPPFLARAVLALTTAIALSPVLLVIVGAILVRTGQIDWRVGLGELMLAWPYKIAMVGVATGILGVFAALLGGFGRLRGPALISLLLPLAVMGAFLGVRAWAGAYPPIHDVATDWTDPIAFSPALLRARGPQAAPVEPNPIVPEEAGTYINRPVSEVNADTCPGARPARLRMSPQLAFQRARQAVLDDGAAMAVDDPGRGRFEATATGLLLGFKDDVAVRVRPDAGGARVDVRSVSRNAVSTDLGVNCARVTRIVRAIQGG